MSKTARTLALVTPLVGMMMFAPPVGASGGHDDDGHHDDDGGHHEVVADLHPIPGSGVHGSGHAEVEFDQHGHISEFELRAEGLLPAHPHAAHIHFGEQARHECPTLADDTNEDGHLNTTEGAPAYGPVVVSLTTKGDTSPESVLAITRYDTASNGTIDYEREEHVPTSPEVAAAIAAGEAVVVIHGVDYNGDGVYSGETPSDLDETLPTEATDPALCGVLSPMKMHEDGEREHDEHGKHEHGNDKY